MDISFWEARVTLYDSHVDDVHVGFYMTEAAADQWLADNDENANGAAYLVEHTFSDA